MNINKVMLNSVRLLPKHKILIFFETLEILQKPKHLKMAKNLPTLQPDQIALTPAPLETTEALIIEVCEHMFSV